MGQEALVNEQLKAGEEFLRGFAEYVSVAAAFWINPADSDEWYLYIASADINDDNFDIAYREVLRRIGNQAHLWLDAFKIKLLNSDAPLAAEVIKIRNRYSGPTATRYNGSSIAGMAISGAYIYPPITARSSAV